MFRIDLIHVNKLRFVVFFKNVCKSFFLNTYFLFYLLDIDLKFKHTNFKTFMNFTLFYLSIDLSNVCVFKFKIVLYRY
jgi:hypothetical protein